jgi:3-deoxy-D-manno-octulosonic-acid transferase
VQVAKAYAHRLLHMAPLMLTVQTRTGRQAAAEISPAMSCTYAPLDHPPYVRRFLQRTAPRGLVLFETELWPHWLRLFSGPIWIANARLSDSSLRGLLRFDSALRPMWLNIRWVLAQGERDRRRFAALGVPEDRIEVTGQIKQFTSPPGTDPPLRDAWRSRLGLTPDDHLVICGSVREDELLTVLRLYCDMRAVLPRTHLLLAPRHLQHVAQAERLAESAGLRVGRASTCAASAISPEVVILDSHGELAELYAAGDLTLLGGTFTAHGGHNPNEPARYGVPVITGPHTENIEADLTLLASADLAYRVENLEDIPAVAVSLAPFDREQACRRLAERLASLPHPADRLAQAVEVELYGDGAR